MSNDLTERPAVEATPPSANHFVAPLEETPLLAVDVVKVADKPSNLWIDAWRDARRRPIFWISGFFIVLVCVVALFPGLFTNHSLVITAAHQQKGKDNVVGFSNDFPFSKGYSAESLDEMNKVGFNYHFPIAYPDAGIANLVYFLRVRGNVFYDYTHANDFYTNGTTFKADFRSTGAEVFFDTK